MSLQLVFGVRKSHFVDFLVTFSNLSWQVQNWTPQYHSQHLIRVQNLFCCLKSLNLYNRCLVQGSQLFQTTSSVIQKVLNTSTIYQAVATIKFYSWWHIKTTTSRWDYNCAISNLIEDYAKSISKSKSLIS